MDSKNINIQVRGEEDIITTTEVTTSQRETSKPIKVKTENGEKWSSLQLHTTDEVESIIIPDSLEGKHITIGTKPIEPEEEKTTPPEEGTVINIDDFR